MLNQFTINKTRVLHKTAGQPVMPSDSDPLYYRKMMGYYESLGDLQQYEYWRNLAEQHERQSKGVPANAFKQPTNLVLSTPTGPVHFPDTAEQQQQPQQSTSTAATTPAQPASTGKKAKTGVSKFVGRVVDANKKIVNAVKGALK